MIKLLYITNGIDGAGGLERVLSVKASYLADKLDYEVHILTLNDGDKNLFYEFSDKIKLHDIKVGGNPINYFLSYKKEIKEALKKVKPDVISVCDDGLKGMMFPLIFGKKIPVIYERHVSRQIEIKSDRVSLFSKIKNKSKFILMNYGGSKFKKFVVLTDGNTKEWNLDNLIIIPNPMPFKTNEVSNLKSKNILVVGRQAYQKGYDRLLDIWKMIHLKYPDWKIEIYGKEDLNLGLELKSKKMGLSESVKFKPPIKNIQKKYKEASIYLMTSRFEGFGMVLIEAMNFGVPCVSFDCPHGPADIIQDNIDGFLIKKNDMEDFSKKVIQLIENKELRNKMGANAKENVKRYSSEKIVSIWDDLFKSIIK